MAPTRSLGGHDGWKRPDEHRCRRRRRAPAGVRPDGRRDLWVDQIALAESKTSVLFNGPVQNPWECCTPSGPAPATELTNGRLIPYADGAAIPTTRAGH